MNVQIQGVHVPIKQIMVLGIRLPADLPLGPRGGVISLTAADGPEREVLGPDVPTLPADPPWRP